MSSDSDTEKPEVSAASRNRVSDLEVMLRLQKLSTLSITETDLGTILHEIIDVAIDITCADFGTIQLIDPGSSRLRIVAQRGFPQWWVDFWNNVPEGQGAYGASLQRGERTVIEHLEQSPMFGDAALEKQRRVGVRALQSTPLMSRSGNLLGLFSTYFREPQRLDENEIRVLDLLARQAADIIDHIQSIARLRDSEERFRSMADGIPLMIWVSHPDGRARFINRAYAELHGVTLAEVQERGWQSLIHPDDLPAYAAEVAACLRDRRLLHAEIRVKWRDGSWRWIECVAQPRISSSGEFLGFAGASRDITDRKALEDELRLREQRHRLAISGSPVVVWECDTDLRFTFVDNLQPPVTDPALIVGKRDDEILPFESVRELIEIKKRVLASGTGERQEIRIAAPSHVHHFEVIVEPVYRSDGTIVGLRGVAIDISEQKRAEEVLRSVSAELGRVLRIAAVGLTHCSRELRYVSANPAYAEYVGLPVEQIVGRSIAEVLGETAFEVLRPRIERVLHGEIVEYEDEVPVRGVRTWIRVTYMPDRDVSGNVVGWVASVLDITQCKLLEEQLAEEGRRKDEFLNLLGHELRNPLATISTAVESLSGDVSDAQREYLNAMTARQLKLMRRLLDDVVDLGRITHGYIQLKRARIDLAKFLRQVTAITRSTVAKHGQELILRLPPEAVIFAADEARLEQVVINLLTNASKYTAQGGTIELSGAREDSEIVIRCRDNGRGISREMQQKIFEPFTRVEPFEDSYGEASLGLGLPLAKRLVELHGGTIAVESGGLGRGSEFVVRFPVESAPADDAAPPEVKPVPASRRSRLLVVVEDNADLAGAMVVALERAGYQVVHFADAFSALAGLSDLTPHAVLLDIGLPGMDGYSLAVRLRQERHLQHAILIGISGFKGREASESGGRFDYFFNKPVDVAALLTVLDTPVLEATEAASVRPVLDDVEHLKVLLVDDNAELLAPTAALLRDEGLDVRCALSGHDGLEAARDFRPDLILCDLKLPDMSGQKVIQLLRSNLLVRGYAVILTALSEWEIRELNREAKKMGIDEFLPKPLTRDVVRALVTRLKQQRSARRGEAD